MQGLCCIVPHANLLVNYLIKVDYPAACNAVEQILAHRSCLSMNRSHVLDRVIEGLLEKNVEIRCDQEILSYVMANCAERYSAAGRNVKLLKLATDEDFDTEFLSLTVAMKLVNSLEEAIAHINEHSSKHTDCIITADAANARLFMKKVDSAGVYWNASTRFADGFRYGFGTEVGVGIACGE